MAPALPRTSFNSSRLVRFLSDLAIAEPGVCKKSLAEQLGQWMDWTDAISLSAALNYGSSPGLPDIDSGTPAQPGAVIEEYARVRRELARSITTDAAFDATTDTTTDAATDAATNAAFDANPAGMAMPVSAGEPDHAPWRRLYQAHQRTMEARIRPLRLQVRSALSGLTPQLRRLAALDAIMDEALLARERHLLSKLPQWLEGHFSRLRNSQLTALAPEQRLLGPAPRSPSANWLALYCKDTQGLLLAELELRLQPVQGMIDALGSELAGRQ